MTVDDGVDQAVEQEVHASPGEIRLVVPPGHGLLHVEGRVCADGDERGRGDERGKSTEPKPTGRVVELDGVHVEELVAGVAIQLPIGRGASPPAPPGRRAARRSTDARLPGTGSSGPASWQGIGTNGATPPPRQVLPGAGRFRRLHVRRDMDTFPTGHIAATAGSGRASRARPLHRHRLRSGPRVMHDAVVR